MLKNHDDLQQAIEKDGYPNLEELTNKFIFILSGDDRESDVLRRRQYYNKFIKSNVLFVDIDCRTIKDVRNIQKYLKQEKNRIFYNISAKNNWSW